MRTLTALFLLAGPVAAQIIPGPRPAKADPPAVTATEAAGEWVVRFDGRTFRVPQPETRESAIKLAKLAAGVTEATAPAPAFVPLALPAYSTCPTGNCPNQPGTTIRRR